MSDPHKSTDADSAEDRQAQAARPQWSRPQLRRIAAKDAQAKSRAGVEMTRHLTS